MIDMPEPPTDPPDDFDTDEAFEERVIVRALTEPQPTPTEGDHMPTAFEEAQDAVREAVLRVVESDAMTPDEVRETVENAIVDGSPTASPHIGGGQKKSVQ